MTESLDTGGDPGQSRHSRSTDAKNARHRLTFSRDRASSAATRIGDLARSCGVTQRALRHYEAEGLIRSSRTHQGERLFTPRQCDIAHLVVQLRSMDIAIADIRAFLDDTVPEAARIGMLRRKLELQATALSSRLASLRRCLEGEGELTPLGWSSLAGRSVRDHCFG